MQFNLSVCIEIIQFKLISFRLKILVRCVDCSSHRHVSSVVHRCDNSKAPSSDCDCSSRSATFLA
jgi:hypothetical protein